MQDLDDLARNLRRSTAWCERGDPESPLRSLLAELGYSLQANAKVREGTKHPDRNAQFEFINARAETFLAAHEPVISVDTNKKEFIGDYKNGGRASRFTTSSIESSARPFRAAYRYGSRRRLGQRQASPQLEGSRKTAESLDSSYNLPKL